MRGAGGRGGPKIVSWKMKTNFGKPSDRKQNSEGRQTRLSDVDGANLNGDYEQRRSCLDQSGYKPACFDRGNTDRFKAQRPIWLAKTKRRGNTPPTYTKQG